MNRALKWSVRVVVGLAALLLLVLLATLTTVDHTPYRDLPAWRETAARLEQLRAATNVAFGELRAGFGRAKLTPALGAERDEPERGRFRAVPLAGYGARQGRPATGVHQDLWVKAVAFAVAGRTGVVVTADALIIPREVGDQAVRQLRETRGLTREAVYLSATHTHSGLGGWGQGFVAESFAGRFVPGIREWFARQLAAAAVAALDDLAPASFGEGGFEAPDFVRNRLLGDDAPKDPEFRLLLVKQADGDTAVLGSYTAHSTVLPAANLEFSGDYPSYWSLAIERVTAGLALFLAGGMGSHGPRAGAPSFEGAQRMGNPLAARTVQALTNVVLTNRLTFGLVGAEVTLPALQRIRTERGLTATIGIAANKLLAKIASDFQKPDGLTVVSEREKVQFLRPLPVRVLYGVGQVTEQVLQRVGIRTVGDLQDYGGDLRELLGSFGPKLKQFALGEDDRPLELGEEVKSISGEETFLHDTDDRGVLRACLRAQAADIAATLKRRHLAAHTIQVKVRYGDFTTLARQITVEEPIAEARDIYRLGCFLLGRERLVQRPLRLLGLGVSNLREPTAQQLVLP